mmetsp:Transcript_21777/g.19839  ORF Transcript_21777/g.19839 Transcript_21777/m.19839 type:complete len:163 (+) Transcript_21777:75-563(+)
MSDKSVITANVLKENDFDVKKLLSLGYDVRQLKHCGFDASDLKSAGLDVVILRNAGFTLEQLRDANFSINEIYSAGFNLRHFKKANYTAKELYKSLNCTKDELLEVGYNSVDLKFFNKGYKKVEQKVLYYEKEGFNHANYPCFDLKHLYSLFAFNESINVRN